MLESFGLNNKSSGFPGWENTAQTGTFVTPWSGADKGRETILS
jgi:hypothetical protein